MSLFSNARSPEAHWSVDFVEHLRTVHFALISACVLLVVVSSGKRDADIDKALTHATGIQLLVSNWNLTLHKISEFARISANLKEPAYFDFLVEPRGGKLFPSSEVSIVAQDSVTVNWQPWFADPPVLYDAPQNLYEFQTLWNRLHSRVVMYLPDQAAYDHVEQVFCNFGEFACSARTMLLVENSSTKNSQIRTAPLLRSSQSFKVPAHWHLQPGFGTNLELEVPFTIQGKPQPLTIAMRVPVRSAFCDETAFVLAFRDFGSGDYNTAFAELATLSKEKGWENIAISDVVSRIKDMQAKGEQTIEVVGLKLPSAEIVQWGLILILCTQFYFWLHLHELNKKIDATSPGWDVAWVGMYTSLAARLTMCISACLLPLAAVALLAVKILASNRYHVGGRVLWTICYGAIITSGLLALATSEHLQTIKTSRGIPTTDSADVDVAPPV